MKSLYAADNLFKKSAMHDESINITVKHCYADFSM